MTKTLKSSSPSPLICQAWRYCIVDWCWKVFDLDYDSNARKKLQPNKMFYMNNVTEIFDHCHVNVSVNVSVNVGCY